MSKQQIHLTAAQVDKSVREYYSKNGYVALSQVRNSVGFAAQARTADMLVMSTWPSRGLYATGVEIKVSRGDFMREMADPKKADDMAQYCRHWYVAAPQGLIKPVDLPLHWGLLEVDEKLKCKQSVSSGTLSDKPMDTAFVCAVIRNFQESHVPKHEIEERIRAAEEASKKSAKSDRDYELKLLRTAIEDFSKATGVNLLDDRGHPIWNMKGVGEAVRILSEMRQGPGREIEQARTMLARAVTVLTAATAELDGLSVIGQKVSAKAAVVGGEHQQDNQQNRPADPEDRLGHLELHADPPNRIADYGEDHHDNN